MKPLKFEKKHKGLTLHLVAIILFSVLCVLVAVHFRGLLNIITTIIDVLMPIFIGVVISLVIFPVQNKIEQYLGNIRHNEEIKESENHKSKRNKKKKNRAKIKVARGISIIISFLIVIAVLVVFALVIIPQVGESYTDLQSQTQKYLEIARSFIDTYSADENMPGNAISVVLAETFKSLLTGFYDLFADLTPYLLNVIKRFVSATTDILLGAVISIYLLLDRERIVGMFLRAATILIPERMILKVSKEKNFIINVFNQYVVGKMIGVLITWMLCFLSLILINVQYAPLISIILAIMNVVPYIGIFIGAIPGMFIIFITSPGKIPLFIIVVILIHLIDNKLIERYVLKTHTQLDSELVIISIVLFSGFFGFWTMFIAAPVATILYHFIKTSIDNRLKSKSLPTETSEWQMSKEKE